MKKIATLTINSSLNYGAVLQSYALNCYLNLQGYEAKVINYTCFRGHDNRNSWQKFRSIIWRNWIRPFMQDTQRIKKTELFKNKIIFTQPFPSFQSLAEIAKDYDVYIVGSDQVWNPRMAGEDTNWFLHFTSQKKIAYAASFGLSVLPSQYMDKYASYIKHLYAISVREESAATLIENMGLTRPQVVMDPIFLLKREQWEQIAIFPKQQKYILCYYMQGFPAVEKKMRALAKKYAREYNCRILNIGKREYSQFFFWENNLRGIGPAEFVGLIANAEMVITNSFHGTAFSVLFDKKFISVVNTSLGRKDLSSRIVDLLTRLEHTGSLLDIARDVAFVLEPLSAKSKKILINQITASKEFLRTQLGGAND